MKNVALPLAAAVVMATAAPATASGQPVTVVLPQCPQASAIGTSPDPSCSYVALKAADGRVVYAYMSQPSGISWRGTRTGTTVTFPASAQTWPQLSIANGLGSVRLTPSTITGTVSNQGDVSFTTRMDVTISAAGQRCTATGDIVVTSAGTAVPGGDTGRARQSATGTFAAAGSSTSFPALTGSLCSQASQYLDLTSGVGMYLVGVMDLNDGRVPATKQQTVKVALPTKIKRKGTTVVLPRALTTDAGQPVTASLTWSTTKKANGSSPRFAKAVRKPSGRLVIRTTGKAKRLYVRVTLTALPGGGYTDFLQTRVWTVR